MIPVVPHKFKGEQHPSVDGSVPADFGGLVSAIQLHFELLSSLINSLKDQHERELAQYEPEREQQPEPEARRAAGALGFGAVERQDSLDSQGFAKRSIQPSKRTLLFDEDVMLYADDDRPELEEVRVLPTLSTASATVRQSGAKVSAFIRRDTPAALETPAALPSAEERSIGRHAGAAAFLERQDTPAALALAPRSAEEEPAGRQTGAAVTIVQRQDTSAVSSSSTIVTPVARVAATKHASLHHNFQGLDSCCSIANMSSRCDFQLLNAIKAGCELEVQRLLEASSDPNMNFGPFTLGMEFRSGAPLAVAVLRGKISLVHVLVEARADLESEYGFNAGAEQKPWTGTALHATIPSGNLDMMKVLADLGANLQAKGSNNCTLLWQAAYFGKCDICAYLLDRRISVEHRAISQDDELLSYTPLHTASMQGHHGVVKLLLQAKANVSVDSGGQQERQPIEDAVQQGHCPVVELLVAAGADLFRRPGVPKAGSRSSGRWSLFSTQDPLAMVERCIDKVFKSRNPALITAVAKGLKQAPALLDELCAKDLVEFLSCRGEAPMHILGAIFRPYMMNYWDFASNKRRRMCRKACHICAAEGMNSVEGPHFKGVIEEAFKRKLPAADDVLQFIDRLAPQDQMKVASFYSPATFFMCHIPSVHRNLNVLVAIADCGKDTIFEDPGCQAIVNLKWTSTRWSAYVMIGVAVMVLLLLEIIAFALTKPTSDTMGWLLVPASVVALVTWLAMLCLEVVKVLGYISCGLFRRYVSHIGQWADNLALGMTGGVINALIISGPELKEVHVFAFSLGVVTFCAWIRVLTSLKVVEAVGLRILPITATMQEAGPFCIVLLVYLLGSTSLYFALGIASFSQSFVIFYRLLVLQDFDLPEMENVHAPTLTLPALKDTANGSAVIGQSNPEETVNYWPVRILMVACSFLVGILMMNIFIAILCRSYCEASRVAREAFVRCRLCRVLDHKAISQGLSILTCQNREQSGADRDYLNAKSLQDGDHGLHGAHNFIWYCCPKEVQ